MKWALILLLGLLAGCSGICSEAQNQSERDSCLFKHSFDANDSSLCEGISSELKRDSCYMISAFRGDFDVCELLSDKFYRESCFHMEQVGLLEFEKEIKDIHTIAGLPVTIRMNCNQPCKFYDDTILFDIDENEGVIQYLSDDLDKGMHNITISATDGIQVIEQSFILNVSCNQPECSQRLGFERSWTWKD